VGLLTGGEAKAETGTEGCTVVTQRASDTVNCCYIIQTAFCRYKRLV